MDISDEQLQEITHSLGILATIADAYDDNALDDEARKIWGKHDEYRLADRPDQVIELYSGRGGRRLLTLQDCLQARDVYRKLTGKPPAPVSLSETTYPLRTPGDSDAHPTDCLEST